MAENQTTITKILSDGPSIENIVSYSYKRYDSEEYDVYNYHCLLCDIVCSTADESHLNVCRRKSYKPTDTKIIKCGPCNTTVNGLNRWMDYHEQTPVHRQKYRTNCGQLYWYYCRVCKITFYDTEYSIDIHILQGTLSKVVTPTLSNRLSSLPSIMRCMAYVYKMHMADRSVTFTDSIHYCEACDTWEVTPQPIYSPQLHSAHINIVHLGKRLYYKFYCVSCRVTFICEKSTYKSHLSSVEHTALLRMAALQTCQNTIKSWNVPKIILYNFEGLLTVKRQEMVVTVCKLCGDTLKLTTYDDVAVLKHVFESCSRKLTTVAPLKFDVSFDVKVWCGFCSKRLFGMANWMQHVLSASHMIYCRTKTFEFYNYYICTKCTMCFQLYFGMAEDMPFKNHEYQLFALNNLMRYIYREVNEVITDNGSINLTFFYCQKTGNFGQCNRSAEPDSVPNYCHTCRLEFYGDPNIFRHHTFTIEHILLQFFIPVKPNKSTTNSCDGQLTTKTSEKDNAKCHSWSMGLISQLKAVSPVNKIAKNSENWSMGLIGQLKAVSTGNTVVRSNENKIIKNDDNKVNVSFANIPSKDIGDVNIERPDDDSKKKALLNPIDNKAVKCADNNNLWSMRFMSRLNVQKATIDVGIVTSVARGKENKEAKKQENKMIEDGHYIAGEDTDNKIIKNTENIVVNSAKDEVAKDPNNVEIIISDNKALWSTQSTNFMDCPDLHNVIVRTVTTVESGKENKTASKEEITTIENGDNIAVGDMDNMTLGNTDSIVDDGAKNEVAKIQNNVEDLTSDIKTLWSTQSMNFIDRLNVRKVIASTINTITRDKKNKTKGKKTIKDGDNIAAGDMDNTTIKNNNNIVKDEKVEVAKVPNNENVIISDNKTLWSTKSMSFADNLILAVRKVTLNPANDSATDQEFKMLNRKQNKTIEGADNKEVGDTLSTTVGKNIVYDTNNDIVKDMGDMEVAISTDTKTISWSTQFINLKNHFISRKMASTLKHEATKGNENKATEKKENKTIEDAENKAIVNFANNEIGDIGDINIECSNNDLENETLVNSIGDKEFKCADNNDIWFTWFISLMDQLDVRKAIVSTINTAVRSKENKTAKEKENKTIKDEDNIAGGDMDNITIKNTDNIIVEDEKNEMAKVPNNENVIISDNKTLWSTKSMSFADRLILAVRKVKLNPANDSATDQELNMLNKKENKTIKGANNKEVGDTVSTAVGKTIVHDTNNDIVKDMGDMEVAISTDTKTISWPTQFINLKNHFIARKMISAVEKITEDNKNEVIEEKDNMDIKDTENEEIRSSNNFAVEDTENTAVIRGMDNDMVNVADNIATISAVNIDDKVIDTKMVGGSDDMAKCEVNKVIGGDDNSVDKSVIIMKTNDINLKVKSIGNKIVENVENKVVKCLEIKMINKAVNKTIFIGIGSKNDIKDMNSNVVECVDKCLVECADNQLENFRKLENKMIERNNNILAKNYDNKKDKEVIVGVNILEVGNKEHKVEDVNTYEILGVGTNEIKRVNDLKIGIQSVLDAFLNFILLLFLRCSEFFERYSITE